MITLNSISKVVGKGQFRRVVLNDINWILRPRTRVVILGHRESGARMLLNIIGAMAVPTSGWVERTGSVSLPGGFLRYARNDTAYQLVARLSQLYRVDKVEIIGFLADALGRRDVLTFPVRQLPGQIRLQLNAALTYALPFDFYLFDSTSIGPGTEPRFAALCREAFELRRKHAGIIMTSYSSKAVRRVCGDMMGALIYKGSLTLYERATDAATVFDSLPPEVQQTAEPFEEEFTDQEEDIELL